MVAALLLLGATGCGSEFGVDKGAAMEDSGFALPEGTIRVDVSPAAADGGFLPQSFLVAPDEYGEGIVLNQRLAATVEVSGVLTADVVQGWTPSTVTDGGPLPAIVRAESGGLIQSGAVRTDETGAFVLLLPGEQVYDLAIIPDDASVAPLSLYADFDVAGGVSLTQTLKPAAPVYGRVTDDEGNRIGGAVLLLRDVETGAASGTFLTDESGWYVARAVAGRDYLLESVGGVIARGAVVPTVAMEFTVADDDGGQVDLSLGFLDTVRLDAYILDATGAEVDGATARLTSEWLSGSEGSLVQEIGVGSNGILGMNVLPGQYTLEIWPDQDDLTTAPLAIRHIDLSSDRDLGAVELAADVPLTGRITGESGNDLSGASVTATQVGFAEYAFTATTNNAGEYRLDLPAAVYDLTVAPASPRQGALTTVRVDLRKGAAEETIPLSTGTPVEGVVMAGQEPLAYSLVLIVDPNTGELLGRALTDSEGKYSIRVEIPEYDPGDGDTGDDDEADTGGEGADDTGAEDTGDGDTGASDTADTGR